MSDAQAQIISIIKAKTVSDQFDHTPIVKRVEEAIRVGFNSRDGSKFVGIYEDGFRYISQLIMIRDRNDDPAVRVAAFNLLKMIDSNNGIGAERHEIRNFILNVVGRKAKSHTWSKLDRVGVQLSKLRERSDIGDNVKEKIDDLLGGVVDGKIMTHLLPEAKKLIADHKISKVSLNKKMNSSASYVHAIAMACQMCDNLSDIARHFIPEDKKSELVSRLNQAVLVLLEIQNEILEGGD